MGLWQVFKRTTQLFIKETMAFLPFLKERAPNYLICNPIEFVGNRLEIPSPKFRVGDRVKYRYVCDDELEHTTLIKRFNIR